MKVDDLILELQDLINDAKQVPFSGHKVLVSSDEVFDIIDRLQEVMPAEVKQAKNIVADRKHILTEANREAESIIRNAEERRKAMLNQNEITREAQTRAREIIEDAKQKSMEIRKATNNYVDSVMQRAEETLSSQLEEVKKTRASVVSSQKGKKE